MEAFIAFYIIQIVVVLALFLNGTEEIPSKKAFLFYFFTPPPVVAFYLIFKVIKAFIIKWRDTP
mgnify:CR=1 FL=1